MARTEPRHACSQRLALIAQTQRLRPYCLQASFWWRRAAKYLASPSSHRGMVSPKRFSFSLLNTEYAGRCTGLLNSLVLTGVRFTFRASSSKILRAN